MFGDQSAPLDQRLTPAGPRSCDKDFPYPTKTYLPRKLKEEDWLD